MTPLLLFLLGVLAIYVSTVTTAFSALMRLSLRLMAERGGRGDLLGRYLDEPLRLFLPARLILSAITVGAAVLIARVTTLDAARGIPVLLLSSLAFVLVCEHLVPLAIVRRDPERILELLLPSFHVLARVFQPITASLRRLGAPVRERTATANGTIEEGTAAGEVLETTAGSEEAVHQDLQEGQARELLRSLVEFRETMVREVMTPRPDIVAISDQATMGDLLQLVREQQYSRVPVYKGTLDNIVGMIPVKDLILVAAAGSAQPITSLIRPVHFVPETKLVSDLLKEFQRKRIQAAMVVDEYGGTAGLVTVEDLLEEIVGEIRDEYDTELEPVVDEGEHAYVFSGRTHVRALEDRLNLRVEGNGYETVGGYLMAHLGRVPAVGERFTLDGLDVEVLEAERRRINRVRIRRHPEESSAVPEV